MLTSFVLQTFLYKSELKLIQVGRPEGVHETLLRAAGGPSVTTEAVDTSVSLLRFQMSSRPVPSTVANTEGWVGLQATSYTEKYVLQEMIP